MHQHDLIVYKLIGLIAKSLNVECFISNLFNLFYGNGGQNGRQILFFLFHTVSCLSISSHSSEFCHIMCSFWILQHVQKKIPVHYVLTALFKSQHCNESQPNSISLLDRSRLHPHTKQWLSLASARLLFQSGPLSRVCCSCSRPCCLDLSLAFSCRSEFFIHCELEMLVIS